MQDNKPCAAPSKEKPSQAEKAIHGRDLFSAFLSPPLLPSLLLPLAAVLRARPRCSGGATSVPVDTASWNQPAQVLGIARPGQRHLFIQRGAEGGEKQGKISHSSRMMDTVPLTAKVPSVPQG